MRTTKISLNFARYTDADLFEISRSILLSMTDNPAFLHPLPPLTDLETAIKVYHKALIANHNKGRIEIVIKQECRKSLQAILKQLGMYVMYVANGDKTILISSGYPLTKEPQAAYITNPGIVNLKSGINSGELNAKVKMVKGAKNYLHQITPDPLTNESIWESIPSSCCRYKFTELKPGKKYWIRTAALGSGGQIAFSPPNSQYVQ